MNSFSLLPCALDCFVIPREDLLKQCHLIVPNGWRRVLTYDADLSGKVIGGMKSAVFSLCRRSAGLMRLNFIVGIFLIYLSMTICFDDIDHYVSIPSTS